MVWPHPIDVIQYARSSNYYDNVYISQWQTIKVINSYSLLSRFKVLKRQRYVPILQLWRYFKNSRRCLSLKPVVASLPFISTSFMIVWWEQSIFLATSRNDNQSSTIPTPRWRWASFKRPIVDIVKLLNKEQNVNFALIASNWIKFIFAHTQMGGGAVQILLHVVLARNVFGTEYNNGQDTLKFTACHMMQFIKHFFPGNFSLTLSIFE